jgi:anthranilate phosphoribosyltransferase
VSLGHKFIPAGFFVYGFFGIFIFAPSETIPHFSHSLLLGPLFNTLEEEIQVKKFLSPIMDGQTLSVQQSREAMDLIMNGEATESELASFLSLLRFRGESVDELTGFVMSMREHALKIEGFSHAIDTCGTGGDQASTYNISTASAILLSAAGITVAKHGNRAVSSKSGSADVLNVLGIPTESAPEEAVQSLTDYKMCFLYAPYYHQSMRHAMGVRKTLGFRTAFNYLGPLINPVQCKRQVIGVSDREIAKKIAMALNALGTEKALIVTGADGLDELSVHGPSTVIELNNGQINSYVIHPEDLSLKKGQLKNLQVKDAYESADKIQSIFAQTADEDSTNTLLLNAAAGFYIADDAKDLREGYECALMTLESGLALQQLEKLREKKEICRNA